MNKSIVALVALFLGAGHVYAQMAPPFLSDSSAYDKEIRVKCIKAATMKEMLDQKGKEFHIIMMGQVPDSEITKVIFRNKTGDLLVVNMTPYGEACILDIIPDAYFSTEFKPNVHREEGNN